MYIFVVAMCGGFDADLRYDFALLPLYGVRLVTYVFTSADSDEMAWNSNR